jgi:hypothetical protein
MASRTTNASIEKLRERHAAEQAARLAQQRAEAAAVDLVGAAGAAVEAVRSRRADALAALDAEVVTVERGHEVALTVLAMLLGDDEAAASIAGVDVTAIRTARRRAPREEVDAAVKAVRSARPSGRRRGGRPDGRRVSAAEPSTAVDDTQAGVAEPVPAG